MAARWIVADWMHLPQVPPDRQPNSPAIENACYFLNAVMPSDQCTALASREEIITLPPTLAHAKERDDDTDALHAATEAAGRPDSARIESL
jgi:hypothetical protein